MLLTAYEKYHIRDPETYEIATIKMATNWIYLMELAGILHENAKY